jgi:hypothetical protein
MREFYPIPIPRTGGFVGTTLERMLSQKKGWHP